MLYALAMGLLKFYRFHERMHTIKNMFRDDEYSHHYLLLFDIRCRRQRGSKDDKVACLGVFVIACQTFCDKLQHICHVQ